MNEIITVSAYFLAASFVYVFFMVAILVAAHVCPKSIKSLVNRITMRDKNHFDYKEESSPDFRDGYNKGRRDLAIEILLIMFIGLIVGWVYYL